jgi:glucose/arabinose dehydrogenase
MTQKREKKFVFCLLLIVLTSACQTHIPQGTIHQKPPIETVDYVTTGERAPSALSQYQIKGTCNGLPRVKVSTAPGFCLGLVDAGEGMVFPRQVLALNVQQLLVIDMGGWAAENGKLYLLTRNGNRYERKTLLDGKVLPAAFKKLMDRPHSIQLGPDQKIWISSVKTIYSVDPLASNILSTVQIRLDQLPDDGLHPLKAFIFDDQGHLYLNMGASSNNCQADGIAYRNPPRICEEGETRSDARGLIRRYNILPDGKLDPNFTVFAKGLRNSVAMLWSSAHQAIIQGENARDAINKASANLDDATMPADEINIVTEGRHYGWPYCYNVGQASPEFSNFNCSNYQDPKVLLPAHSAPLGFHIYRDSLFPKWYQNRLLVALHGYREKGHRIVAFLRDDQGLPTGRPLSVVYGWDAQGTQAMGSPVSLSPSPDGSLFITEDKSRKVLQLFYDSSQGDGKPVNEIGEGGSAKPVVPDENLKKAFEERLHSANPPLFTRIQDRLIHQNCVQCHGGETFPNIQLKAFDDRGNAKRLLAPREGRSALVLPGNAPGSELYQRITATGGMPLMPPMGYPNPQEQESLAEMVKQWIEGGAVVP